MKLDTIASLLMEVKEDDFIGTSPSFRKLEEAVYSSQVGWCAACQFTKDCRIFMALSALNLKDFKADVKEYASKIKEGVVLPSIELGVTVKKCGGFKKLI